MKKIGKALIVALASALLCTVAQAQAYPNRSIRLVVPYPAGGIADTVSRSVGQQLARRLGQPVVVDNRPGGKQIIATEAVTKAAPDGYTLLLGSVTNLSLNPAGIGRLPYNVERDLAPVSQLFHAPLLLVTNQPVANAQELIARIKDKPGKFAYASIGAGTSTHIAAELLSLQAGLDMVHVPYKGSAPAVTDLVGKQVQLMFDGGTSSLPFVREGKLTLLAVTTPKRFPYLPDVPTMAEVGLKDYDVTAWWGIVAPAGTPKDIVERLAREIKAVTEDAALREQLAPNGVVLQADGPREFREFIQSETVRWRALLKKTKIDLEN